MFDYTLLNPDNFNAAKLKAAFTEAQIAWFTKDISKIFTVYKLFTPQDITDENCVEKLFDFLNTEEGSNENLDGRKSCLLQVLFNLEFTRPREVRETIQAVKLGLRLKSNYPTFLFRPHQSPLMAAVAMEPENIEPVQELLENGADPLKCSPRSRSPFTYALHRLKTHMIDVMRPYIPLTTEIFFQELQKAILSNDSPVFFYWVSLADDEKIFFKLSNGYEGQVLLTTAVQNGQTELIKPLIARGCDMNQLEGRQLIFWNMLFQKGNHSIALEILAYEKFKLPALMAGKLLLTIINTHHIQLVKVFLAKIKNFKDKCSILNIKQNGTGNTPLHIAATYTDATIVTLLLNDGADPNILNQEKFTALTIAIQKDNADCIKAILYHKNHKMTRGGAQAAILMTVFVGNVPLLSTLLKEIVDVKKLFVDRRAALENIYYKDKCSPLQTASEKLNLEMIEYLLDIGVDSTYVNPDKQTALTILMAGKRAAATTEHRLLYERAIQILVGHSNYIFSKESTQLTFIAMHTKQVYTWSKQMQLEKNKMFNLENLNLVLNKARLRSAFQRAQYNWAPALTDIVRILPGIGTIHKVAPPEVLEEKKQESKEKGKERESEKDLSETECWQIFLTFLNGKGEENNQACRKIVVASALLDLQLNEDRFVAPVLQAIKLGVEFKIKYPLHSFKKGDLPLALAVQKQDPALIEKMMAYEPQPDITAQDGKNHSPLDYALQTVSVEELEKEPIKCMVKLPALRVLVKETGLNEVFIHSKLCDAIRAYNESISQPMVEDATRVKNEKAALYWLTIHKIQKYNILNQYDKDHETPLYLACKSGNSSIINALFDQYCFNASSAEKLLAYVSRFNQPNLMRFLKARIQKDLAQQGIAWEVFIQKIDTSTNSILHNAVLHDNAELVTLLLDNQVSPYVSNGQNLSPLAIALLNGKTNSLQAILDHKQHDHPRTIESAKMALFAAVASQDKQLVADIMMQMRLMDSFQNNALFTQLIDASKNEKGESLLDVAGKNKDEGMADLLIASGAQPRALTQPSSQFQWPAILQTITQKFRSSAEKREEVNLHVPHKHSIVR